MVGISKFSQNPIICVLGNGVLWARRKLECIVNCLNPDFFFLSRVARRWLLEPNSICCVRFVDYFNTAFKFHPRSVYLLMCKLCWLHIHFAHSLFCVNTNISDVAQLTGQPNSVTISHGRCPRFATLVARNVATMTFEDFPLPTCLLGEREALFFK